MSIEEVLSTNAIKEVKKLDVNLIRSIDKKHFIIVDSTGVAILYSDYAEAQKILNASEGKGLR